MKVWRTLWPLQERTASPRISPSEATEMRKRACIGEGNQDDAILAIASCFLDRPDVEEIFQKAINVVNELKSEKQ